ncbi:MAG: hypothetical protein IT435_12530 [Phycisphaerales bacterium]|nr:hypothetical protein [Phycisphaerales bacterium]
MIASRNTFACLLLASLAGTASAQSTSEYVSGFLHGALGEALFAPVEGRRLPVKNLGSSGQDGVEIRMSSAQGGGVVIDAPDLKKKPGSEIKIKFRGWDGMIYGNHRMIGNGDGSGMTLYDYSESGATGIRITTYNELGEVISDENFPGPIVGKEWVPDFYCADGSTPIPWGRWVTLCNTCEPVWVWGWTCSGTGDEFSNNYLGRTMVTPTYPVGTPHPGGFDSTMITARGMSDFAIEDTHIGTFGVSSWGLGDGRPVEECENPGDCSDRALIVNNLGSSGQDGVAIDVGPKAGHTSIDASRGGWDLQQATKFYDEDGTVILTVRHGISPTGEPAMSADFSGLGIEGYVVTYYDEGDVPLGNEYKINYDTSIGTVLCGPGYRERWEQGANGLWYFAGCDLIGDIVIPGHGKIGPVAYMTLEPVGAEYHRVRRAEITGSDEAGPIVVTDVSVVEACGADFDHTGFVDTDDYDAFVLAFEAGTEDADFDGSGFVDTDDFDAFVQAFEAGC